MYIDIYVRVVIGRRCVGVRVPSCVEESTSLIFFGGVHDSRSFIRRNGVRTTTGFSHA